jgi:hypothetical protein
MVVHVDDRGRAEMNFAPLDVFRWQVCTVDATGAENGEEVLTRAGAEIAASVQRCDGLPAAMRVDVTGACSAHAEIAADPQRWTNLVRSTALQQAGGDVWIEKVYLRTSQPLDFELSDGPLAEIRQYIEEIKHDDTQLAAMAELLNDLHRKLPEELKDGSLALDRPDQLRAILDEVEPLLWGKLREKPGVME